MLRNVINYVFYEAEPTYLSNILVSTRHHEKKGDTFIIRFRTFTVRARAVRCACDVGTTTDRYKSGSMRWWYTVYHLVCVLFMPCFFTWKCAQSSLASTRMDCRPTLARNPAESA